MDQVLPDLPRPTGCSTRPTALPACARACSARAGRTRPRPCCPAVRTARPGSSTGCWPSAAGCGWCVADDLEVGDGEVRHRSSGDRLDALYLRLDVELVDLDRPPPGAPVGAEIFDVAAAGGVVLANAPGQRSRRRQGDVLLRPRADRLLPGRAPAAGVGADLSHRRRGGGPDRAGPGRRAGQQAGGRPRRRRGADRPGRRPPRRWPTARAEIAANPARLGGAGGGRPVVRTRPSTAAGCSRGTSTCARSSTCAARARRTVRWPTWP